MNLVMNGRNLKKDVWRELKNIREGEKRRYREIERDIEKKIEVREVERENGEKKIDIVIKWNRVIGEEGELKGYGGGIWRKKKIIEIEEKYRR